MSDTKTAKKWDETKVAKLLELTAGQSPVSGDTVEAAATALGVTARSVAAKLRQMDIEVASMAHTKAPTFSAEAGDALAKLVNDNPGVYTYKELAEVFPGGFTAKQIQGKLLALELTSKVKPAEKVEAARTYTPEEEAKFVSMANSGAFIEDIATALGKEVPSVRGKALSLSRTGEISKIPAQRESHKKNAVDPVDALGEGIAKMTVEEIAKAVDKTERGVRTLLTRRGIAVANYDGKAKQEKAASKKAAAAAA